MHIVDDVPELSGVESLVMVVALEGFLDAGNAGAIASRHLVAHGADGGGVVVATFDVDQLHDYRARRPPMSFVRDHYEAYDAPRLVVRLLRDVGGTPYLLLHGPEPDIRWEGFCPRRQGGRRPLRRHPARRHGRGADGRAAHPADRDHPPRQQPRAADRHQSVARELRVPSSAQALLELRMGEWGQDAQGFVAHVPHYLAQLDYPRAAIALLGQVELAARLTIDLSDLDRAAEDRDDEIARYLAANAEVGEVVAALEQQYDAFARAEESGSSLLAEDQPLPTGEEIGQQFEQFLAGLERPDETGGGS
ncbi:PAC2 family protein [Nocardioides sp. TF02-7]|nr:PAC2 family protein [Nocardioides sp. TF02-7]UMG92294.1 PAC2 family protein [Nocardioides sp. TF02-7]